MYIVGLRQIGQIKWVVFAGIARPLPRAPVAVVSVSEHGVYPSHDTTMLAWARAGGGILENPVWFEDMAQLPDRAGQSDQWQVVSADVDEKRMSV